MHTSSTPSPTSPEPSSPSGSRMSNITLTKPPPPGKKHHLTPHEIQAQAISKLLQHPEKEVYIPAPAKEKTIRPPREMMKNVTGSSAGAGSGEFHVYKHARRREYERIKLMEEGARKLTEKEEFAKRQAEQTEQDDAKTAKNRAKREKKKLAALKAKAAAKGQDPDQVNGKPNDNGESQKRRKSHNQDVQRVSFKRPDQDDEDDDDSDEGGGGDDQE